MRSHSKTEWWRSALPTVSWTLVCCLAMVMVLAIITGS